MSLISMKFLLFVIVAAVGYYWIPKKISVDMALIV